jgi:tetratricopeptide (TPR) repeat protein
MHRHACWIAAIACLVLSARGANAADLDDAQSQILRGEYDACISAATEAMAEGVYGDAWYLLKAEAELATGRYADALATTDAGLAQYAWSIKLRMHRREALRFCGRADEVEALEAEVAALVQEQSWRYTDGESLVLLGRLALDLGADAKQVQDGFFQRARRNNPAHRLPRLALGELALDKRDFQLAADTFEEALQRFPDDPDFLFGLAEAVDSSDAARAAELRAQVAEINPRHVPLLLGQVDELIAAEQYGDAQSLIDRVLEVNPSQFEALAYRAAIAHVQNDVAGETAARDAALKTWTTNPEVDHILGRELSQKYRFQEGAEAQRRALEFNPFYLPAQKQLAQDLLRLGQEEVGWELVESAYNADQYDVTLFNLMNLRDSLEQFTTLERDGFIVRMERVEAEIYGEQVLRLLGDARATLTTKYGLTLDGPVLVEIFPNPADFAVRTFGIPGVAGYLGVCFGDVITANSPASQTVSPSNWESVLWHEFAHVVTLNLTHNRMPRWFSEGISVYEERQRNPACGERMTPLYREFILSGELTPVGELSGAFLSPESAQHLAFAYFQSSLVIEHLVESHGFASVVAVLNDLGAGVTINEALERHTVPLPQLEVEFAAYATARANEFCPEADWSTADLDAGAGTPAEKLRDLLANQSSNYQALSLSADLLLSEENWTAAVPVLRRAVELYPDATGREAPQWKLAEVYRKLGREQDELAALTKLTTIDPDAPWAFLRLVELESARGNWKSVALNARRMIAVDPLVPHGHRYLAQAAEALSDRAAAKLALRSLLAARPGDPVDTHYRLAKLLADDGESVVAKRHVLQALEQAPRYRAAHALLLELVSREEAAPALPEQPETVGQ